MSCVHQINVFELLATLLEEDLLPLVQGADVFEELVLLVHHLASNLGRRRPGGKFDKIIYNRICEKNR
jgi:hypothetical protein